MNERRKARPDTPLGFLQALPALVLLDRLRIPILAATYDGRIVHANPAFEAMLGVPEHSLTDRLIDDLLHDENEAHETPEGNTCGLDGRLILLRHSDGTIVRTVVNESALLRKDDPLSLVLFHDVTEQLWTNGTSK